ncbi:MAG: protein phosphatase CheZ [Betaproteobacteria bacterium]|nr:protein phosphatase CheZ [Betaproteobacteria bacterium]
MTAENDSADLEALFDSLATMPSPVAEATAASPAAGVTVTIPEASALTGEFPSQESVFQRIGQMARQLHNTLQDLGYDKILQETVNTSLDARDRLAYVANITEQAACRVLNATDIAQPVMTGLEDDARALGARWDKAFANQVTTEEFRQLAEETRAYLKSGLSAKTSIVNAQLMEIMMAQDFQDLTGQVIKKVVAVAQELENGLMSALLEVVPQRKRSEELNNLMNGPVIHAEGRTDVVANQQQVDDLLESLGF